MFSFLLSDESPFALSEQEAVYEHAVSTITCLLSGIEIFCGKHTKDEIFERLINGLHAFHLYATHHWFEHLLAHITFTSADADPMRDTCSPSPLRLALDLASKLVKLMPPSSADTRANFTPPKLIQDALSHLQSYPDLCQCAVAQMHARSIEGLDSFLSRTMESFTLGEASNHQDGISLLLAMYQAALAALLNLPMYKAVPSVEFERFKLQFYDTLYTCRLATCSRATMGFKSKKALSEHETSHLHKFFCTAAGCQYPPFKTATELKRHTSKYHCPNLPRKFIRPGIKITLRPINLFPWEEK